MRDSAQKIAPEVVKRKSLRLRDLSEMRDNFGMYFLRLNPTYRWVGFQQDTIVPALHDIERGDIKRLMIFLPPGHSKSELCTRHFIPWYTGRHPKENTMVISYSASLATDDFGANIKRIMQSPVHLACFPQAEIDPNVRSKRMLKTVEGGTFYSVGFGGTISGKRCDLIVLDDSIKNPEEAFSETHQQYLIDIYDMVVKTRLRPNAKIVICMTRWAIRDIAARILEKEKNWYVLKLKAEDPAGCYLWEDYYGRPHYEDAKANEDVWSALWQQEPQASKSFCFREEWLQFYDIGISPGRYKTYMLVDPAGAKEKRSDSTSIQVWAAGQDKKLFLADWVWDKFDPGERIDTCLRLCRRWEPEQILYEEFGLMADTYYLTEKMQQDGFPPQFYPIAVGKKGPRKNLPKEERIKGIIPFFREGKIFLPRRFPYKTSSGKIVDLTRRFIDSEYRLYKGEGSIQHDDDLDNMSRLLEPELQITYYEPKEERTRTRRVSQGTWESAL